jgi:hypothetical protein
MEENKLRNGRDSGQAAIYAIKVKGNLGARWSDWFDGFSVAQQANDVTVLTGQVVDQAALHGLLAKIRDLGLPLLSVERVGVGSLTQE